MCDDIQWMILGVSWKITGSAHKNADIKNQVFQIEVLTIVLKIVWNCVSFVTFLGKKLRGDFLWWPLQNADGS